MKQKISTAYIILINNCITSKTGLVCFRTSFRASPTISLEDDGDVVLDKGADVEQHGWRVNSAETELYVIRCVVVAEAEVVIVRVNPVGPCCFI